MEANLVPSIDGPVRTWDIVTGVKTEDGVVVEDFSFIEGYDRRLVIKDGELLG